MVGEENDLFGYGVIE